MLDQGLIALASAAGTAVVQAAGTDAWETFRLRLAGWFGRGDAGREFVALQRLELGAAELTTDGVTSRVRDRQQVTWQTRFETLLEDLEETGRAQAAAELRELLSEHAPAVGDVSAGRDSGVVGGDAHIQADQGSAAAVRMGDVAIGNPPQPDQPQG